MYKCKDCNSIIENKDVIWRESYPDADGHYSDGFMGNYATCPFCGGDDIEYAAECKGCGEPHGESDLTEGFCEKCEKEIQDKVYAFFEQFTEAEKDYIFESGILDEVC